MLFLYNITTKRAFTLTEVIVVAVILGIVGVMAMPLYHKVLENARNKQAIEGLKQIRTAERVYRMKHDTYVTAADINEIKNILGLILDVDPEHTWAFEVSQADSDTFEATATRTDGSTTITINQDGEIE